MIVNFIKKKLKKKIVWYFCWRKVTEPDLMVEPNPLTLLLHFWGLVKTVSFW